MGDRGRFLDRLPGGSRAIVLVLVLVLAVAVAGYYDAAGVSGLVVNGSVFGEEQQDGTVHVSPEDLPENRSYTVTAEDEDVCIGNCPGAEEVNGSE